MDVCASVTQENTMFQQGIKPAANESAAFLQPTSSEYMFKKLTSAPISVHLFLRGVFVRFRFLFDSLK